MRHESDDAKLTAYALGELGGDEAREIESILAADENARREVEAIRAVAGELTDELAKEPMPEVAPVPRTVARRWPARLAIAAAASIVVGGMAAAILIPAFETPRYQSRRLPVLPTQDHDYAAQSLESTPTDPFVTSSTQRDATPVPKEDVLRYPSRSPHTNQQQAIEAQRQEIRYTFDTATKNAREALRNNDFNTAQLQVERARAARVANPQMFTQGEINQMEMAIAGAQQAVDTRQREFLTREEARERSETERGIHEARRRGAGERERTVSSLVANASRLEREGRTQEAQAVRDQISVIEGAAAAPQGRPSPSSEKAPELSFQQVGQNNGKGLLSGGQDGQNVLNGDGYVEFQQNPFAGAQRDSLQPGMPSKGVPGAIGNVPRDAKDSVLLPLDEFDDVAGVGPPARNVGPMNTEAYDRVVDNAFVDVVSNPLSTFSIDVDTASYSNVRRFLTQGQLPPRDAVRIEEMVNYFPYDYAPPAKDHEHPFNADVEVTQCPWKPEHRLVRVALKGMEIAKDQRPPSNLVFLIDVSGSMQPENKLPLLKESMKLLVGQLKPSDRVSMVVYAGSSGLVLPSTPATRKDVILGAIDRLEAGGSTNGAQGIELAYQTAVSNFIKDGVNRVVLCTDGDFNVGVTNQGDLTRLIEDKAKTGVFLSVLGFGMGNVKDSTMEKLADKGNGNYAYIDTLAEGKKVLVDQMSSTLVTIAKDVKIQIEFNPAVASAYRLIGYENRMLAKEDFNDDKKDAGEIGAGHTVTALYEVVPAGKPIALPGTDPLKYQSPTLKPAEGLSKELMTLKLRYKAPDGDVSKLMEVPVTDAGKPFAQASADLKFASGVAGFGMILRDSPHKGSATLGAVIEWAQEGKGRDDGGYRKEFVELVNKARELKPQ